MPETIKVTVTIEHLNGQKTEITGDHLGHSYDEMPNGTTRVNMALENANVRIIPKPPNPGGWGVDGWDDWGEKWQKEFFEKHQQKMMDKIMSEINARLDLYGSIEEPPKPKNPVAGGSARRIAIGAPDGSH